MERSNGARRKSGRPRNRIRYLPCTAEPGMFNGELLVFMKALDPDQPGETIPVQMLVDQSQVENLSGEPRRKKPVSGWVRVSLANEQGGVARVVLPQPGQPVGESMWVDVHELKDVAGT